MSGSGAKLIVEGDPSSQKEYILSTGTNKIGREAFCDIIIYDPEVSRHHAQIIFHGGEYLIEDLGSTNGTFVNGRRITSPTPLNTGDIIELGASVKATFSGPTSPIDETILNTTAKKAPQPTLMDTAEPGQPFLDVSEQEAILKPPAMEAANIQMPPPRKAASPPKVYTATPQVITQAEVGTSGRRRTWLVIGCLILLIFFACAATLFLLDTLAPDFLYCGPARPLSDLFGFNCP